MATAAERSYYLLFFIDITNREVLYGAITTNPISAWTTQAARNLFVATRCPFDSSERPAAMASSTNTNMPPDQPRHDIGHPQAIRRVWRGGPVLWVSLSSACRVHHRALAAASEALLYDHVYPVCVFYAKGTGSMMAKKLVVAVAFVVVAVAVVPAGSAVAQSQRFPDVAADHYAFEAIEWAATAGVTLGFGDGTFKPSQALSRWQALTFMERYYDEILQANESADFTRADMMVLLKAINDGTLRNPDTSEDSTADASGTGGGQRFPDVGPDHYAFEAIEWAAEAGVTLGFGDGTFKPSQALGRWQALTFMERYYDEILQANESDDFTRADMMVLLKAINDGTLRDTEDETPEDTTQTPVNEEETEGWVFEIQPSPVWQEGYAAIIAFIETGLQGSGDEETLKQMWNELLGDDCDADIRGVCRGTTIGQRSATYSRIACPKGWSLSDSPRAMCYHPNSVGYLYFDAYYPAEEADPRGVRRDHWVGNSS